MLDAAFADTAFSRDVGQPRAGARRLVASSGLLLVQALPEVAAALDEAQYPRCQLPSERLPTERVASMVSDWSVITLEPRGPRADCEASP